MAGTRVSAFLKSLSDSQLLEPGQLKQLSDSSSAQGEDVSTLARDLVQRGWLTRFQINQVGKGKSKDLAIGPYRLLDILGEGGMGQVFKAQHQPMNRTVALKVIRPEMLANTNAVKRFYREVEACAKLRHPNIVMAFDSGQHGDTHYFAMEYVEGVDLSKMVKEKGALPVAQACDYIRQAALGLQHAHEQGLVHRDIKPANLLVTNPQTQGAKAVSCN